ncbi:MAG TPA: XrtA-associated tyrosine autokinase [Candidatus Competibacteraceae bacterium]|nr:XrtA-associated tyrosine autokinase [Candidatus Competibacteraceae bacterium]
MLQAKDEATLGLIPNGVGTPHRAGSGQRVDLDLKRLGTAGLLVPGRATTLQAEEYRRIRRTLLSNAFLPRTEGEARSNLIMITSALPNEGKTFTTINLALSIANGRDRRVLLVDADVTKPDVEKRLGISVHKGLADFLAEDALSLEEVLLETNIPGFSLLPAGPYRPEATELLASNRMRTLVGELATRFADDVVLFDGPPLLPSSDAIALSALVGQIVVVVAAEETAKDALRDALEMLDASKIAGLILNKGRKPFAGNYLGYGYPMSGGS